MSTDVSEVWRRKDKTLLREKSVITKQNNNIMLVSTFYLEHTKRWGIYSYDNYFIMIKRVLTPHK